MSMRNPSVPSSPPTIPYLRNMASVQTMTRSTCAFCYALEETGRLARPYMTASKPCSQSWESRSKSTPNRMKSKMSREAATRPQGIPRSCRHRPEQVAIRVIFPGVLLFTHPPRKSVRLVRSRNYGHRPAPPSQISETIRSREELFGHPRELPSGHRRGSNVDKCHDNPHLNWQEAG